jgi:hypothetical protein
MSLNFEMLTNLHSAPVKAGRKGNMASKKYPYVFIDLTELGCSTIEVSTF